MSAESTLVAYLVGQVSALAYVSDNNITVKAYDDQDDPRTGAGVIVRVAPRERIAPNYPFYRLPVEFRMYSHRGDDPNKTLLNNLYSEVAEYAYQTLAKEDIAADGITYAAGFEAVEEKYHMLGVDLDVFKTIN